MHLNQHDCKQNFLPNHILYQLWSGFNISNDCFSLFEKQTNRLDLDRGCVNIFLMFRCVLSVDAILGSKIFGGRNLRMHITSENIKLKIGPWSYLD
jgi:hypothetical protein